MKSSHPHRLLTDEDVSFCWAVTRGKSPHATTVKRLLEDRQARIDREKRVREDFDRLDKKYGNDWTEWQDVRESLSLLA